MTSDEVRRTRMARWGRCIDLFALLLVLCVATGAPTYSACARASTPTPGRTAAAVETLDPPRARLAGPAGWTAQTFDSPEEVVAFLNALPASHAAVQGCMNLLQRCENSLATARRWAKAGNHRALGSTWLDAWEAVRRESKAVTPSPGLVRAGKHPPPLFAER